MKVEDFTQIEMTEQGVYRMVPENQLRILLAVSEQDVLPHLIQTYGTLLRVFRGIKNLNQCELSKQIGMERKVIYLLEENKTSKPKIETHTKLTTILGSEFDLLARKLNFID